MRGPRIVLCRHGNTFGAGETPYMVGKTEDLPLTAEGERQGIEVGQALKAVGFTPNTIIAGPLIRTRRFADLIREQIGTSSQVTVDSRLAELDYGAWSGKTTEQIIASGGEAELANWNDSDRWPTTPGFLPIEDQVRREWSELLRDVAEAGCDTLLVSSNGRMRILSRLLGREESGRVGTGKICILDFMDDEWFVRAWGISPDGVSAAWNRP